MATKVRVTAITANIFLRCKFVVFVLLGLRCVSVVGYVCYMQVLCVGRCTAAKRAKNNRYMMQLPTCIHAKVALDDIMWFFNVKSSLYIAVAVGRPHAVNRKIM